MNLLLTGIEVGADLTLYGVRLHFTNGVSSPYLQASRAKLQAYQVFMFEGPKCVKEICIDQEDSSGDIYGLKMIDDTGLVLIERAWRSKTTF